MVNFNMFVMIMIFWVKVILLLFLNLLLKKCCLKFVIIYEEIVLRLEVIVDCVVVKILVIINFVILVGIWVMIKYGIIVFVLNFVGKVVVCW